MCRTDRNQKSNLTLELLDGSSALGLGQGKAVRVDEYRLEAGCIKSLLAFTSILEAVESKMDPIGVERNAVGKDCVLAESWRTERSTTPLRHSFFCGVARA